MIFGNGMMTNFNINNNKRSYNPNSEIDFNCLTKLIDNSNEELNQKFNRQMNLEKEA